MLRNNKGYIGIIALVVGIAIIVVLAAVLWPRYTGSIESAASKKTKAPLQQAKSVDCMNNLQQIRTAITMYRQSNEQAPASLTDLTSSGLSESMLKCPTAKTPYSYDPSEGRVWCTTPGHERN